jgi:hypothetical protein
MNMEDSVPKRRLLNTTHSPMNMEQTQCSETSAIKYHPLAYEYGTDTDPKRRLLNTTHSPMNMEHSVPKRRLLNTTQRGKPQKIARNIQNTAKA